MRNSLITLLATAGCLLAQRPAAPPIDAIKAYLNLTDAQVQALRQIQQQDQQANIAARQKLRQSQTTLDDLLQKGGADPTTLGTLLLDIQDQLSSLKKTRSQPDAQAAATLTPEQKTKLAALQSALQLAPAIHEASSLGLLAMPQNGPVGGGGYRRGPGGPGSRGGPQ